MESLNEKSKSKSQQRLMGMVHAYKKGDLDIEELPDSLGKKIKGIADGHKRKTGDKRKKTKGMGDDDVKDFASTKHKGLPEKVKENLITKFDNFLNESTSLNKIYLAGGWDNWRDFIISKIDNAIFLDPRTATDKENWFEREVNMITECDGLIAWVTKDNPSGFGMTYEMGMMYGLNKPYILINEKEDVYKWSMQTEGAINSFTNIEDALKWIEQTKWLNLKIK